MKLAKLGCIAVVEETHGVIKWRAIVDGMIKKMSERLYFMAW